MICFLTDFTSKPNHTEFIKNNIIYKNKLLSSRKGFAGLCSSRSIIDEKSKETSVIP